MDQTEKERKDAIRKIKLQIANGFLHRRHKGELFEPLCKDLARKYPFAIQPIAFWSLKSVDRWSLCHGFASDDCLRHIA